MASNRTSGTKKSANPKTTVEHTGQGKQPQGRPARAHRNDTPEAKTQQSRASKTHPTRNPGAVRKDKPAGSRA